MQQQSPIESFLKFSAGFLTFIALSFILTISISSYLDKQAADQQAAAALAAMLK